MSGATTGKVGFVEELNEIALLNQRVGNFKIKEESLLNKKYLYYFIISDYYQKEVKRIAGGCAQPNISAKKLESIPIILPSLEKQKGIVEKLENVEKLIKYRNKTIELLDLYIKSVFSNMFGSFIKNSKSWKEDVLGNCVKNKRDFVDGPFGSNLKASDHTESGVRLIQINNIGERYFINKNKRFTSVEKYDELIRHEARKGDIVIAKMGEPLGRACILPDFLDKSLVVADCMRLRVTNTDYNSYYLMFLLNDIYVKEQLKLLAHGSTRVRVNLSMIKKLKIYAPPIELQNQFAGIAQQVEEIKKYQQESKMELENLFNNLMQKAFKGD